MKAITVYPEAECLSQLSLEMALAHTAQELIYLYRVIEVHELIARVIYRKKPLEVELSLLALRAVRKLGERLAEMPRAAGTQFADGSSLKEFGVDNHLSARAQQLAKVLAYRFDAYLCKCRDYGQVAQLKTALRDSTRSEQPITTSLYHPLMP